MTGSWKVTGVEVNNRGQRGIPASSTEQESTYMKNCTHLQDKAYEKHEPDFESSARAEPHWGVQWKSSTFPPAPRDWAGDLAEVG